MTNDVSPELPGNAESNGEARTRAILEAALDCIITMDSEGRVVEFNPAAERVFGYGRAEVLGRALAELIIPPHLRERHRKGMAHYLATGEGPVLGRRVELSAMRRDGSEFPIELAITRISIEGPPLFTAYLRDIGDRVRGEQLRNVRFAVTQQLTQATSAMEAAAGVLRAVCEHLRWELGIFWCLNRETQALEYMAAWSANNTPVAALQEASCNKQFNRDEGLPGRVWASGRPTWVRDVTSDRKFIRAQAAAAANLRSAFACPVVVGERTLGVIEFFTQDLREPDAELLETMGTVAGHVGQFLERLQTEERLRESEARFRALMDQAPFSMQVFSPTGRTLRVNRAWSELWGVTLDQIADYNVLEDQQLEAKGVLAYLRRAFAGEAAALPTIRYDPNETIPDRSRHSDPVRYVAAVAYPLKDAAGRVQEIVLVHEDITGRKRAETAVRESEEKLRLLADTIPQLAWMAGPDGSIFWYNRRWYEYTGGTLKAMEGWGWQSVHDPATLPEVLARWKASISSGEPFDMVFPLKGADGIFRPFLTRVNPLRDPDGSIVYWFGTNTDISEIKRMEEALRVADRRKDEFIATLAHELRNPLAPIRHSVALMGMVGPLPEQLETARLIIDRQARHLTRLVDDLLEVSRITQGKMQVRKERISLQAAIHDALQVIGPAIKEGEYRLDVTLSDTPLEAEADATRISQIFLNLLQNAIKFTPRGGQIWLLAERRGNEAVISVRDAGEGIARGHLSTVFEMFSQLQPVMERNQGGLGIGLALVKGLVELHGGTVRAESPGLGQGSEFIVQLPLAQLSGPAARPDSAPSEHIARRRKILVVDDNQDSAGSLRRLLEIAGHTVREVHDGMAGIEAAAQFGPEVVLLDIGMPRMNGYEAAKEIRRRSKGEPIRIVAMTGWGQEADKQRALDAGFDLHMTKPVDPNALLDWLKA